MEVDTYYQSGYESSSSGANGFIIILTGILVIYILTAIVAIAGSNTTWFQSLNIGSGNVWILWIAWIVTTLISYIGLYLFHSGCDYWPDRQSRNLAILFLIGAILSLAWIAIFFYGQNIGLSLWLVSALFIYKFTVFAYMWSIRPLAAIFLIPLLLFYVYLFYAVGHLATLNKVPL